MKAAFIKEHGNIEKLIVGELNAPKIAANEVLIETKYVALNHIDLFLINGWPGLNLKMPHVLGSDGSGIIKKVGSEVTNFQEGDRVSVNPGTSCGKCHMCLSGKQVFCKDFSIMGEYGWGTFAQYFKVPEVNVLKLPSSFTLDKAAAAPLTFLTAYRMLKTQARMSQGDIVFIHGAGGGVSSAAIQIAKYFSGTVIATTSNQEKMRKAKDIGADFVINYKETPNYDKYVYEKLTNKQGVDIIIDSIGKATFQTSLRLLRLGGRLITPGCTTGPLAEIDIRHIFWKHLEIKGSSMGNQSEFREVMDLIFKGYLDPIIDKTFDFDDIVKAENYLNEGKQFGKVLVKFP